MAELRTTQDRFSLQDLVVIITGGGKGIGKVYGEEFARAGSKLVLVDIDPVVETVAQDIQASGGSAIAMTADISTELATKSIAQRAVETFGRIDVLINNASLMSALARRPWHEIPVEEWDQVMAVNLRGMFLCCRAVYPAMSAQKRGKIVNISSGRVFSGSPPNRIHYTTSKAGVIGFTRTLAREVGEDGITVNAVTPGFTLSDSQKATSSAGYINNSNTQGRALPRDQFPEDLVGAVMFLSSAASDFITGQTVNVDGGLAMH